MTATSILRPPRPLALAAAALSGLLAGCGAGTLSGDGREISEAESRLVFDGPDLEGGFRQFFREDPADGAEWIVGVYGPVSGRLPRAELIFYRPPPLHFLSRPAAPGDLVDDFEFFSGRTLYFGETGQATNRIGAAQYRLLTADDMSCVVFILPFGSRQHGMAGNKTLFGFYCRDAAAQLDAAQVERIVAAVGHADFGAPSPASGARAGQVSGPAAAAVPARVDWEGRGSAIEGSIAVIASAADGEFRLRLDDGTSCAGQWTHLSGSYGTDAPPSGRWDMLCDNGLSAAGTYVSPEQGAGDFTGSDRQGRAVRLRYGAT